jgi:hypothetical protein
MIAELSEIPLSNRSGHAANPTLPLPRLDLPLVSSRWVDEDGRELTDLVDPPIAGLPVSLRDRFGLEIGRTTTDSTGSYRFDDIPRDDLVVIFTVTPSGGSGFSARIPIASTPDSEATTGSASDRRPASYWPGDSVVPSPVHTWLPNQGANGEMRFSLEGTLN